MTERPLIATVVTHSGKYDVSFGFFFFFGRNLMISHEGKPQVVFFITEFEMEQMEVVHGDYVHF